MSSAMYFVQECPICGRALQVRMQHLGKTLKCRHCNGDFEACDPDSTSYPPKSSSLGVLERAEQLLNFINTRDDGKVA